MSAVLSSPRRLLSAGLAILLGVAFIAATLILTTSLDAGVRTTAAGSLRDAKAVVTRVDAETPAPLTDATVATVAGLPGVDRVRAIADAGVAQFHGGSISYFALMTPPEPGERTRVTDGHLPTTPGEAAVNTVASDLRGWRVGDTITLGEDPVLEFRLTGIVDAGADTTAHPTIPRAFVLAPDVERLTGLVGYAALLVHGPGTQTEVVATLASAPALANTAVRTADEAAVEMIEGYTRGSEQLTTMLLAFGTVAVVVAGLDASVLAVAPRDIVVPLVVGVLLAVAAAVHPARQATRVPPLAALRPLTPAAETIPRPSRTGIVLAVLGFLLLAAGALALPRLGLAASAGVAVGILGGLLSVTGVLLLARTWVPALARALGRPLRRIAGIPGDVAAENAVRNPGRAAATAGALLVGVTLVTMMTVGASVGQATIQSDLDLQYPVDALVSGAPLSDAQVTAARTHPEVAASTVVRRALLLLEDGQMINVSAFDPDADATLRADGYLDGLADGVLLVGQRTELVDGSTITLRSEGSTTPIAVTVRISPTLQRAYFLTTATLTTVVDDPEMSIGVRIVDGADAVGVADRLGQDVGAVGDPVFVSSAAVQRAEMQGLIDTILLVVLGLLGVAVVIALVGIGNTLSLSVHERRQESGLLRALGLTRGQLRAALGWEALLLAAAATSFGLVLGTVYGLAGVMALIGGETSLVVSLPWARLAVVAVVALAAGWLASVLPSIRAAKVPPAAALALGE